MNVTFPAMRLSIFGNICLLIVHQRAADQENTSLELSRPIMHQALNSRIRLCWTLHMYPLTKRLFDVLLSSVLIIPAAVLTGIIGVLIKLDSEGPVLFRQCRVGRFGNPFICYKLRTMTQLAPQAASHEVSAAYVTRLGRFLRVSKIDELPQLWNVLMGEMSFVGPRPCLPVQAQLVELRLRNRILDVRPGITGLSQVKGLDMSDPERLTEADLSYVSSMSFGLDMRILWHTVTGKGFGDGIRS